MEIPVLLARKVAKMFQNSNRGRRKDLYAALAAAAVTFSKFVNDPAKFEQFKKEQFWVDCGRTPEGLSTSKDLLIYLTGAVTRDARRQAGKYAGAIDYMIAHKIKDYKAYLDRFGYEKVLEAARHNNKPSRGPKEKRPFIKVYLKPREYKKIIDIIGNCPSSVAFNLSCSVKSGHTEITASMWPIIKESQQDLFKQEQRILDRWWTRNQVFETQLLAETKRSLKGRAVKSRG